MTELFSDLSQMFYIESMGQFRSYLFNDKTGLEPARWLSRSTCLPDDLSLIPGTQVTEVEG